MLRELCAFVVKVQVSGWALDNAALPRDEHQVPGAGVGPSVSVIAESHLPLFLSLNT